MKSISMFPPSSQQREKHGGTPDPRPVLAEHRGLKELVVILGESRPLCPKHGGEVWAVERVMGLLGDQNEKFPSAGLRVRTSFCCQWG